MLLSWVIRKGNVLFFFFLILAPYSFWLVPLHLLFEMRRESLSYGKVQKAFDDQRAI